MWIEGNYRRNLLDMHINDDNVEYLSRVNAEEYAEALKASHMQAAMVKARSHTGLAYYPTKIGRMHRGLKGFDYFGAMVEACHKRNIAVIGYFSQIFDNWAYEEHPEWRMVTPDGRTFREYRGQDNFKSGRYGIVCPNNREYREYVKQCLTEIVGLYEIDGIFLDMTFFPDICYCPSCRQRYKEETGRELPRMMDWQDGDFKEFAYTRDTWMADFAGFSTACVKAVKPDVTVEHQFSRITCTWTDGSSEYLTDCVDYCGGDYYGGMLQQSFINKYYKSVSPRLPFVYHTSRCDPELVYHTTTKTKEELFLHVITALVHNGAFLLVDAINPDGSIVPEVYHKLMKSVFEESMPYEKYINGNIRHNAAVWFASHAKYNPYENGVDVTEREIWSRYYMEVPVAAAGILRENNLPFDVIGSKNLAAEEADVILLPHVAAIREEEMDALEEYVKKGGNLFISGPIGNPRLEALLGIRITGRTKQDFTYMSPTEAGQEYFEGFGSRTPLTIDMPQLAAEITDDTDLTVLATLTLPYTMTNTCEFAAIHSNPPGIYTEKPCAVMKKVGNSRIIWTAAPIELAKPYRSRQVFYRMIRSLAGKPVFTSNAPKFVEVLSWSGDGREYFAVINEQEEAPIAPMYDIYIEVENTGKKAYLLPQREALKMQETENGRLRIRLPRLDIFHMVELSL